MPKKTRKKTRIRKTPPPILIAHQINRAAEVSGEGVSYLRKAIADGRLRVIRKRPVGKGRGVELILAEELERFIAEVKEQEECADRQSMLHRHQTPQNVAKSAEAKWIDDEAQIVIEAIHTDGKQITVIVQDPELFAASLQRALLQRARRRT